MTVTYHKTLGYIVAQFCAETTSYVDTSQATCISLIYSGSQILILYCSNRVMTVMYHKTLGYTVAQFCAETTSYVDTSQATAVFSSA